MLLRTDGPIGHFQRNVLFHHNGRQELLEYDVRLSLLAILGALDRDDGRSRRLGRLIVTWGEVTRAF